MNVWRRFGLRSVAVAALMLMAMLWGTTFFSIKALVGRLPVPDMLAVRFTVSFLVLAIVLAPHLRMSRATLRKGVISGLFFGTAQLVQTWGLTTTAASVSGFITGLYVVATPLLAWWWLRHRISMWTWAAVAMATVGLGFLSLRTDAGLTIGSGELLTLLSAILFAGHIVTTARYVTRETLWSLTLVQVAVTALCAWPFALGDGLVLPQGNDWWWLLYLAVLCGSLTMLLQVWAQNWVPPTAAAVLMAAEPVWAAAFAVWLGGEILTWRILVGGAVILAAMLLVIVLPALHSRRATPPHAPA